MAGGIFKVTIQDHDYDSTTYTTIVSAESKNQAIIIASALAGGEKMRREHARMGRTPCTEDSFLTTPGVTLEPATADEYHQHQNEVVVTDYNSRRG